MRFRYFLTAIFILVLSAGLIAQGTGTKGSEMIEEMEFPKITWDIPELGEEVIVDTLDNGIVLFMMEDHRLPVFNIRGIVRTGSMYDPEGLEGLASLTGTVMRTGGTGTYGPDSLNALLEYLAASIETWVGDEQGGLSLNCLSKDVDRLMPIFADVVMNPEFRQEKIDLRKDKIKESIIRRNDDPSSIAGREFDHIVYGDHHYGRILEWESVDAIKRQDLIDFHKRYFVPNNTWLGITGDFDMADIKMKLNKVFAGWNKSRVDYPEAPEVEKEYKPGVYLIDKDISQGVILFGHLGIDQHNPDRHALAVMNYILGGGSFTSRMTSVVRSDMGLAYSVGSRFETDTRDVGQFFAYCQTKTETIYKAMYNMLDQVKKIRDSEVTKYELNSAKDSYINRFVFNFTDPSSIVNRLMNLKYDGMPRDFYKNYIANIQSVTKDDVQRVAKEYLNPDKMTYMVVGQTSEFAEQLEEFGKVTFIELEEPIVDAGT